jgi:transposase
MDIQVFIPQQHLVRLIDFAVDRMNPNIFLSLNPGGGRPHNHPQMMLKVILYAYANRIYSSRQIAKQRTLCLCGFLANRNQISFVPSTVSDPNA